MGGNSAKRKAALWVGFVFMLGAALGGVLGHIFPHPYVSASTSMTEPERRARRVEELTRELNLTPEQARQLDIILAQTHSQVKTLHERSEAEIDHAKQNGRDQIRATLTPEQKPKFEGFLKRVDEERRRAQQAEGR